MDLILPDLCDQFGEKVNVLSPILRNFGNVTAFGGCIRTVKCHEDNSFVADIVKERGDGSVLVVDGGGSLRCALLGDNLAAIAASNSWEGIIVFGCVRDVVALKGIKLGVNLINDVSNRTETACSQELTYLSMELAIKAQEQAEKK